MTLGKISFNYSNVIKLSNQFRILTSGCDPSFGKSDQGMRRRNLITEDLNQPLIEVMEQKNRNKR